MKNIIATTLVIGAISATTVSQQRPDFSGTWIMDQQRSEAAVQDPPSGSVTMVIKQRDADLIVEITRENQKPLVITSSISGSEKDSPPLVSAPAARSYWDGNHLITETARNIQGETIRTKEVRTLDPAGKEMTVITTLIVEHGYTLKGAKNYGIGKDVYVKVAP